LKKYFNIPIRKHQNALINLSFLLLWVFVIGGQVSFSQGNSYDSISFNLEDELFTQDSGNNNSHGFHCTFEIEEQEISTDSDKNDNCEFHTPFKPSNALSFLNRIQSTVSLNKYAQIELENYNRTSISLVVLHHSWKGFII
jgi:hypothetical protein|tara:strand:+ start:453 stop:875 length:423 start_codon:yes stop_codon:yes gene_type:complete